MTVLSQQQRLNLTDQETPLTSLIDKEHQTTALYSHEKYFLSRVIPSYLDREREGLTLSIGTGSAAIILDVELPWPGVIVLKFGDHDARV